MTTTALSKLVTTELEVVNEMLDAIGISPVTSITGSTDLDVTNAVKRFSKINRAVQGMGWRWNTRREVKYVRDVNNQVEVGTNVLSIKPTGNSASKDYVLRAGFIYDRDPDVDSNVLSETVYLDIVELLMFEDLPQSARNYIQAKCVREHLLFEAPDDTKHDIAQAAEVQAWSDLINDTSRASRQTIEDNPEVYSSIFGRR